MLTQLSPNPAAASPQTTTMPGVVSVVQPPLPPSAVLTSTGSAPTPKQKKPVFTILLFVILLVVLIGGLAAALYLSSQNQEVRQQASVEPTPTPGSLTYFSPVAGEANMINSAGEIITVDITFDTNPNCSGGNCTATIKATPRSKPVGNCKLNTANVVFYNMQTNAEDLDYPDNVAQGVNGGNANCNRPLTNCGNGSDPNCARGTITAYGPPTSTCGGDPYQCKYYTAEIPFNLRPLDLSCGCSQLDVSLGQMSFYCDDTGEITYNRTDETTVGAYAYGYSTAQCTVPTATPTQPTITNSPTPTQPTIKNTPTPTLPTSRNTPTPTLPTSRNTPTPTLPVTATVTPRPSVTASLTPTRPPQPTATPAPFGQMCVSISANPAQPHINDSVTFTCGVVSGVTNYQFRYKGPGITQYQTLATAQANQSQPLRIAKAGQYTVQCRICPPPTTQYTYCNDPNWGWDTSLSAN